jgi:hypothetical protein
MEGRIQQRKGDISQHARREPEQVPSPALSRQAREADYLIALTSLEDLRDLVILAAVAQTSAMN